MLKRLAIACLAAVALAGSAGAKPPLEAFGDAPTVQSPDLSSDGKTIAYISRVKGVDYLATYDVATGKNEPLIRMPDVKTNGVFWIGSSHIILHASKVVSGNSWRRKYEDTMAFAYNVSTRKTVQLLVATKELFPYQTGLGNIIGTDPNGQHVYMPAYMMRRGDGPYFEVLKVNLDTGVGERMPDWKATLSTVDWVLDANANPVVRVDYNDKRDWYEITTPDGSGGWRAVYQENTDSPSLGVVGLSDQPGKLIVVKDSDSEFLQLYKLSLADGALTGPFRTRPDRELEGIVIDKRKAVAGFVYSGLYPTYDLADPVLNREIRAAIAALPDSAVSIASWNEGWTKVLLYAEGGKQSPRYMLYDRAERKLSQVARTRPEIKPEEVGEVTTVEYKARDGLTIPTLITWPVGVTEDQRENLPLIVMPHGGPESYDSVGFDWLAQFLANEGYLVLQPNFRGSGGFGANFAEAGYGEWGRKMQDDVTDGAQALIKMGWADPNRVCILGWSYGGYAALAGGALTPDLYKCVVSIAGVSDLRGMLADERKQHGVHSNAYRYWTSVIGDPTKVGAEIEAVSPNRLAANFKAPVLLIHGSDDLVVPEKQSELMDQALRAAKKPVTFLRIGKDDHGLVAPESRNKVLTAIGEFIRTHIGK